MTVSLDKLDLVGAAPVDTWLGRALNIRSSVNRAEGFVSSCAGIVVAIFAVADEKEGTVSYSVRARSSRIHDGNCDKTTAVVSCIEIITDNIVGYVHVLIHPRV